MRRSALLILSILLNSGAAQALASCEDFVPFGQPVHKNVTSDIGVTEAPDWDVICHAGQIVAFNRKHNVSDWVAFRLRRVDLLKPVAKKKVNYRIDSKVPENHRVVYDDYTNTGFHRGHLAPAASMKWSAHAMKDSFFMTNMAPQVGNGFNNGIWKSLERRMRTWACQRDILYVVTGPLYEDRPIKKLVYDGDGDGKDDNGVLVDVPSHFFKIALDAKRMEAIAFILPNQVLEKSDLPKYLRSIDEIEARSRLDFLKDIWDGAEQIIESHVQPSLWRKPDDELCDDIR